MFKVLDVFKIGDRLSVTLDGICDEIKNGTKLIDEKGILHNVISVAMTSNNNPNDISKSTTILIADCNIKKDAELSIA